MAAPRAITVEIKADTTNLERALRRAEVMVTRSLWRRIMLRIALWRLPK